MSSLASTPPNPKSIEAWLVMHNSMAPVPHIPRTRCRCSEQGSTQEFRIGSLPTRRRLRFDDSQSPVRSSTPFAASSNATMDFFEQFHSPHMELDYNANQSTSFVQSPALSDEGCCVSSSGSTDCFKAGAFSFGKRKNFDASDSIPLKMGRRSSSDFGSAPCFSLNGSSGFGESNYMDESPLPTANKFPTAAPFFQQPSQLSRGPVSASDDYNMST